MGREPRRHWSVLKATGSAGPGHLVSDFLGFAGPRKVRATQGPRRSVYCLFQTASVLIFTISQGFAADRHTNSFQQLPNWYFSLDGEEPWDKGVSNPSDVTKSGQTEGLWQREKLAGNWGGARDALTARGVDVTINHIGETFSVLSGGLQRGGTYEGQLEATVDTDLEKLLGWQGARTEFTIFQLHDSGHSVHDYVGSLSDPSNIDALPTTRLYTAWFEKDLPGNSTLRIGQLVADGDFISSPTTAGLVNGTFGWPVLNSANFPSGGPAYPLATPGVRLLLKPQAEVSLLSAVFSGDPAGPRCVTDPQICNPYGLTFSTSGGALMMSEVRYEVNQQADATGLAAAYKLGGWVHSVDFADQRFGLDSTGAPVSLASPAAVASLKHAGDWGAYGVIDQMLWRSGTRSISVFARGELAPPDRNLVSWYVDGGIGIKGPIAGREDDTLTFGVAYSQIGKDAIALDRDILAFSGGPHPIHDAETVFELSYRALVSPWWTLQPDIQYIVHPGGNVADPKNPDLPIPNALVVGLRSLIKF